MCCVHVRLTAGTRCDVVCSRQQGTMQVRRCAWSIVLCVGEAELKHAAELNVLGSMATCALEEGYMYFAKD